MSKKGKKEKKNKKGKKAKEQVQEIGLRENPIPLLDNDETIFADMVKTSDSFETCILHFATKLGVIKLTKKFYPDRGVSAIRWMKDDVQIAKPVLLGLLAGKKIDKEEPDQEDIDNEAKSKLLLTTKQLKKKYKSALFVDALEFSQYGKKKLRKKASAKLLESKKVKGQEFLDIVNEFFEEVPTSDFFRFFEHVESK